MCKSHVCQAEDCDNPKLNDPQLYCLDHACNVCIKLSQVGKLASGRPPKNTCLNHTLCKEKECFELINNYEIFCDKHNRIQCQGINKKNKKCNKKVSKDFPYCDLHKHQSDKIDSKAKTGKSMFDHVSDLFS